MSFFHQFLLHLAPLYLQSHMILVIFISVISSYLLGDSSPPGIPDFPPQKNTKNTKKNIKKCIEFTPPPPQICVFPSQNLESRINTDFYDLICVYMVLCSDLIWFDIVGTTRGDGWCTCRSVVGRACYADDTEHFPLRRRVGQERNTWCSTFERNHQCLKETKNSIFDRLPSWSTNQRFWTSQGIKFSIWYPASIRLFEGRFWCGFTPQLI